MIFEKITNLFVNKQIEKPYFIIGCGRSGTTILGNTLALHSSITYLNEPRHLWISSYPEADVWSRAARKRKGSLYLGAKHETAERSQKLKKMFYKETLKTGKPIIVEKLPINSFRLELIQKIFPDAKYIHIYRNGLEVSRSIAKYCEKGAWFGKNDFKWQQLVAYSKEFDSTKNLSDFCIENEDKGLLEWRLNVESVISFLSKQDASNYIELSYADFVKQPTQEMQKILDFMHLEFETNIETYLMEHISRQTSEIENVSLSEKELMLGGDLLKKSIDNSSLN